MIADMKESLTSKRKADTTHVRSGFRRYTARAAEWGGVKYERANYLRPTGGQSHTTPTREDFLRLRQYLRAAIDHAYEVLDAMERHQATDPKLVDVAGMKRTAFAIDTDVRPGDTRGPSRLPHIAPACASLMMAIEQAIDCGLLPADPGRPWDVDSEPEPYPYRPAAPLDDLRGLAEHIAARELPMFAPRKHDSDDKHREDALRRFAPPCGHVEGQACNGAGCKGSDPDAARRAAAERALAERKLSPPACPTMPGHYDPNAISSRNEKKEQQ